jgi:tetratricopeptide (TPR) repeat protein
MVFRRMLGWGKSAVILFTVSLTITAGAEKLQLKDGRIVEGTVKRTPEGYDVTDAAGTVVHVDADNVKGIALTTRPVGAGEAESRLMSLRRSVDNVPDLNSVIDQYNHFIEQNKQSPAAKAAEADLATWRERQEKGMVKIGVRWVTPEEKQRLQTEVAGVADQARQLLAQGKIKDADGFVQRALEVDPTNSSAAYLKGFILFRQDQIQPARKSFDVVLASTKDHAPTLNNIAVILWRQNQQMGALNFYVQAMIAAPSTRQVLDNVAEALNALPANQRQNALTQKAARLFMQQDTELQQQMAAIGWFRWGSTWVPKAQFEKLQAVEKEITAKLDELTSSYDEIKKKVDRVDSDVDDNLRRMKQIEQSNYATDANGALYRLPLPARYYELERDNRQLAQDRADYVGKLDGLRAEAKKAQQQLPTPRFAQMQQMMGPEGTPGLPAMKAGAAIAPLPEVVPVPRELTVPATRPAARTGPSTQGAQRLKVPESLLSPG